MNEKQNPAAGTAGLRVDDGGLLSSGAHYSTDRGVTQVRAADGRVVGRVVGGVLLKAVNDNGFLRTPPAIAWDVTALQQAEAAGATVTMVTHRQTGDVYRADLADFRRFGFPVKRGAGDQTGLALSHWHVQKAGAPVQLALFGGVT